MRATTIGMILATDLSQNFPTINAFKAMLTDYKTEAADNGSPGPSAPPLVAHYLFARLRYSCLYATSGVVIGRASRASQ